MRLRIILPLAAAIFVLPSCDRDRDDKKSSSKPKPKPVEVSKEKGDPSKEVEALTGEHTRLVWTQSIKPGDSDTFATGDNLVLEGLDTRDGLGIRVILSKAGNYSRPLLTCDGKGILFTDKNTVRKNGKKYYAPVVYLTGWKGGKPIRLAEGYAVDCWRDPATGVEWVYAVQDIRPTKGVGIDAQRIVRFPLNDPEKLELVYDETPISADNVQFSRDGTQACGLFPWPHAGVLSRSTEGKWTVRQFAIGCWTSHSPDDSGVLWVFDGNHKMVHMFADADARKWSIGFSDAPGVGNRELYHPRWSNHSRFLVTTGPYTKQKGSSGSVITRGGATAQVLLARLSPTADKVEAWVQVTSDKAGESYPDAWIAGGDTASLEGHSLKRKEPVIAAPDAWPSKREGLLFLWRDRVSMNTFTKRDGQKRESGVDSYDAARFGRVQEMQADGGYFRIETEGAEDIVAHFQEKPDAALEALMLPQETATPEDAKASLRIFAAPGFVVSKEAGKLVLARHSGGIWESAEPLPPPPYHLVVNRRAGSPQEFEAFADGKPLALTSRGGTYVAPPVETIDFGGGWNGGFLNVAIFDRALDAGEAAQNAATMQQRIASLPPQPPRVRLQAKLVELSAMPTPEDISPYTRSLVEYVYEVEKVLEGEFNEPRVLVKHWAMLALLPVEGFPREEGKSYELLLERGDAHANLQGERVMQDTTAFDLEAWVDVSPPRVVASD